MSKKPIKSIIEALLFASSEPLSLGKIAAIIELPSKEILSALNNIKNECEMENKVYRLEEIAQGYQLRTKGEFSTYIEKLNGNKRQEKISQACMEVLAIIAYRQPITKAQIDLIRGVDSSGTIYQLSEKGLIDLVGKLEVPGKPNLYGTGKEFLKLFGLKDLTALPQI
jgi:segregation and condensation protein B